MDRNYQLTTSNFPDITMSSVLAKRNAILTPMQLFKLTGKHLRFHADVLAVSLNISSPIEQNKTSGGHAYSNS